MQPKLLMSTDNVELFYTQLVKHGVECETAAKVAAILASGKPDELLGDEDRQLVTETCQQWSRQHQGHKPLNDFLSFLNTQPILSM